MLKRSRETSWLWSLTRNKMREGKQSLEWCLCLDQISQDMTFFFLLSSCVSLLCFANKWQLLTFRHLLKWKYTEIFILEAAYLHFPGFSNTKKTQNLAGIANTLRIEYEKMLWDFFFINLSNPTEVHVPRSLLEEDTECNNIFSALIVGSQWKD